MTTIRWARAAVAIAALALAAGASAQGLLDGQRFVGDLGEKGKAADERNDVLTFAGGQFHSNVCDKWSFGKGSYKATRVGDAIAFETETVSETDGRLVWRGTIKGDELEGTFVHYRKPAWYRPNPEPIEHWVKAKRAG
ncbi:MAG: hypothetical protein ACHQJ7_04155 [Vicinamibacteria bacterium]|jgi:hypothetical protein